MRHQKECLYCGTVTNENRESAVEGGWTFVDIRAPVRKYLIACPNCFDKLSDDIKAVTEGKMAVHARLVEMDLIKNDMHRSR